MRVNGKTQPTPPTLTDLLRSWFRGVLEPIAVFLNSLGLMPNTMTLLGVVGNSIAALLLARGNFLAGGLLALLVGPIDALDGTMARLRGEPSEFGAFVDSVTDRYSELLLLGGLLWHYMVQKDLVTSVAVFAAASGSVLVSYVKARAESLGFVAKLGILTRVERYLVLPPSLILGVPRVGIWIVAVLGNLTALQRIYHVRRQARKV